MWYISLVRQYTFKKVAMSKINVEDTNVKAAIAFTLLMIAFLLVYIAFLK